MKSLQTLLLGVATSLLAFSAASAAEQHAKANPADSKNCSAYGVGFHSVPGADLCMKIGSSVRAEASGGSSVNWRALNSNPGDPRMSNAAVGVRGDLTTDVRQQTDYGTVRAYVSVEATHQ